MSNETTGTIAFKNLFVKDINRRINGVIKANDEKDLEDEINEYVMTDEIQRSLDMFLSDYNDPVNHSSNGAWISGFYGSGKSHLLKMLSHILGEVPRSLVDSTSEPPSRENVVRKFIRKAEESYNAALAGQLEKTLSIPATSVLFNIDQKADKDSQNALLRTFIRVFDETRGYFGKAPAVARFERDLDDSGKLDAFEHRFEELAHMPWSEGRDSAILWDTEICQAYAEVTGKPQQGSIIQRYEDTYSATVSDFADDVKKWLDTQTPNHRIIFLVDEVGQFIGQDTQLMLSLQSVAEDLAVKTNGRAWVVVTSQEDMDAIIGDQTKQQAYDFSKIKARFSITLKLNSADVVEVIQKRLLAKKNDTRPIMDGLWNAQGANLRTMFEFSEESAHYGSTRAYAQEDFEATYPFVNYELGLFQDALRSLSKYNVFDGRHSSVGERSMLAAFSSTLRLHKHDKTGDLIPFDSLYEGIKDSVQSTANYRIQQAEDRIADPKVRDLGVRILKALFLVKYIDGFHATPRNLRVLLTNSFYMDVMALDADIRAALKVLEHDAYVQRTGDEYQYLTDEEKDIEQEIRDIDIDQSEISRYVRDALTQHVIGKEIRYGKQKASFSYGLRIDQTQMTRTAPLWLNVSTPWSDQEAAARESMGANDSITLLLDDNGSTLYDDIVTYLRTQAYLKRINDKQQSPTRQIIIGSRRTAMETMDKELQARLDKSVENGRFVYNQAPVEVSAKDPTNRVIEGMTTLISRRYPNFTMLGGVEYKESDLARIIDDAASSLSVDMLGVRGTENKLDVPAENMYDTITRDSVHNKLTVTVENLLNTFSDVPRGWPYAAILACIGHLYGKDRIELTVDGNPVPRTEAATLLRSTKKQPGIVVSIPRTFDARKVKTLKDFAKEFLKISSTKLPDAPLDLASMVKNELHEKAAELKNLQARHAGFQFTNLLNEPIELIEQAASHDETWLIDEFTGNGDCSVDELLDVDEDTINPIVEFFNGAQYSVLEDGMTWLNNNQTNISLASEQVGALAAKAERAASDPNVFRGSKVNTFKGLIERLQQEVEASVAQERKNALEALNETADGILGSAEYAHGGEEAQTTARSTIDLNRTTIGTETSILTIRTVLQRFRETTYPDLINRLAASAQPATQLESAQPGAAQPSSVNEPSAMPRTAMHAQHRQSADVQTSSQVPAQPAQAPAPMQAVVITTIDMPHTKMALETTNDIDEFLDAYRKELIAAIENGKKILL